MTYPFGKAPGHLPMRALQAAEAIGVTVRNTRDGEGQPMHWLSFEVTDAMGALAIFAKAENALEVLAPWRMVDARIDAPLASCEEHNRPLICPSCVGRRGGAKGGKTMSKKKLQVLKRIAKRPRPGARKENRPQEVER